MIKRLLPVFLLFAFAFFTFVTPTFSDELDDLTKKIGELTDALSKSVSATKPLESQLKALQNQITDIKNRVVGIERDIVIKKKNIDDSYRDLAKKQTLLNDAIRHFYIKSYYNSPLLILLSSTGNASEITQVLAYQKAAADQDKVIITNIALSISSLEEKKISLENEQNRLTTIKSDLDIQSAKLDKVVAGAKAYQATLSTEIAQLSAKQQQLLAQKLGSLNIPQSAYTTQGGCIDDRSVDPGFAPRFAFFTYGVPNRVGLNQYGAKGRAEAGQSTEQILQAYYNADLNKGYDSGITIKVEGTNEYGQSFSDSWNIEDYVKHIYEMPTTWHPEALKAQAIAARSYALATTNNGQNPICPSQSCQVVKREENSDAWKAAVDATRGWVLTNGGQPIRAWFSSTHGGYVFKSSDIGWSGTAWTKNAIDANGSVDSFADLQSKAYDKDSKWFYCDWGSRAQYNKTAWLKPDEVADIVNVLRLAKADGSTQKHLSQPDKPNPDGTDTWDAGRVRQELSSRGITPYNSVSDVSVSWDKGTGRTTNVTVNGDAGSNSFDSGEFKNFFNLRAPANINIVGPLYNAEKQ